MCRVKVNVHSCRKVSLQDKYLLNTGGPQVGNSGPVKCPAAVTWVQKLNTERQHQEENVSTDIRIE